VEHSVEFNDPLLPEQIRKILASRWLGHTIHFYHQVDSTNLTAVELAQRGAPEGTVVLADRQLRGRGRGDRLWYSPAGVGIYCSIVLRPKVMVAKAQLITLMTGVAVAKAVSLKTGLSPQIKWPNDILVNDKKVAGLLLESKATTTVVEHAVIGIGINVNHTSADLPEQLLGGASSLRMELGQAVERDGLIAQLFIEIESLYERLQREDSAVILEQWRSFSATLGERVRLVQKDKLLQGIAVDITEEGALLLKTDRNALLAVHAGEVEHLRISADD
jgi:BirA family biotin operon repressor/biotin-[acetyl-CoA-carboxylase] ligase